MLKKSLVSPAQPRHAETCLSPGFVLAALFEDVTRDRLCVTGRRPTSTLRPRLRNGVSWHAGEGG
jgi:hypothetical protein